MSADSQARRVVGTSVHYLGVEMVFRGSEAVARGDVTRHELQRWYRPIFPGVYAARQQELSLRHRTEGAWLWSRRKGIIAGIAASALHGATWVDTAIVIEMISSSTRPPRGIVARDEMLGDEQIAVVAGLPVTGLVRTASIWAVICRVTRRWLASMR